MKSPSMPANTQNRTVADQPKRLSAVADRCAAYSLFATLASSPHEQDIDALLADWANDVDSRSDRFALAELTERMAVMAVDDRRREYSALFEVGDDGPPVPLREDLLRGSDSGVRADITLFYEHFGYVLDEAHAWAPDHLSVELEFVQYLCLHEAKGGADVLAWQLGQLDFCERHVAVVTPLLATKLDGERGGGLYGEIIKSLDTFVREDLRWQRATIV